MVREECSRTGRETFRLNVEARERDEEPECERQKKRQQRRRGSNGRKVLQDALPKKEMEFGVKQHTHTHTHTHSECRA